MTRRRPQRIITCSEEELQPQPQLCASDLLMRNRGLDGFHIRNLQPDWGRHSWSGIPSSTLWVMSSILEGNDMQGTAGSSPSAKYPSNLEASMSDCWRCFCVRLVLCRSWPGCFSKAPVHFSQMAEIWHKFCIGDTGTSAIRAFVLSRALGWMLWERYK